VVADRRLNQILEFVQAFTDAEATAARAAMAEPDDDRYLALRAAADAFLGPGLAPVVDRFAVHGGHADRVRPAAAGDIHQRALFALAAGLSGGRDMWQAYVSGLRDPDGRRIDHALSIADVDGRLLIVGREAVNPFADTLQWEPAGGTPLRFDEPPDEVQIERLPLDEAHARFLQDLTAD
jgi:hypothetical protein